MNEIQYIVYTYNKLYASVQASIMFGFGTSMYERQIENWRLMLLKSLKCEE